MAGSLAASILESMQRRETTFLRNNDVFLAAVLADQQVIADAEIEAEMGPPLQGVDGADDEFERKLNIMEPRSKLTKSIESLSASFKTFQEKGRVKGMSRKSVFDVIPNYPERVQSTARALSAFPVAPTSARRLISALKLIVNGASSSMDPDLLAAVLFLRTNWKNGNKTGILLQQINVLVTLCSWLRIVRIIQVNLYEESELVSILCWFKLVQYS